MIYVRHFYTYIHRNLHTRKPTHTKTYTHTRTNIKLCAIFFTICSLEHQNDERLLRLYIHKHEFLSEMIYAPKSVEDMFHMVCELIIVSSWGGRSFINHEITFRLSWNVIWLDREQNVFIIKICRARIDVGGLHVY